MSFKKAIKKSLISLLNPLVTKLGYIINDNEAKKAQYLFEKNVMLFSFYHLIKKMGFTPKHIIDVGANHGEWTRETLSHFPEAQFTLLDPQEWLKTSFQDILDHNPKVQFHAVGAGAQEGSFKFTIVDRDDSCSFRFTEEEAKAAGYKQVEIPVVTLNQLVSDNNLPVPDIIKIDAEGLDIDVLKGASNFFGKTEVFLVEAGVVIKTIDNSFLKMINFMDQNGYRLFEITDINRPFESKVLWLVELVFVKKGGCIDSYKVV